MFNDGKRRIPGAPRSGGESGSARVVNSTCEVTRRGPEFFTAGGHSPQLTVLPATVGGRSKVGLCS